MLVELANVDPDLCSSSAVFGGEGSSEEAYAFVFTEVVRRCRVRYEVERGSSGRLETGGPKDWPYWCEPRRLVAGDWGFDAAGDLWAGGV